MRKLIPDSFQLRRRGKDKTGHTHNGSLLAYASDPAGEKLLGNQARYLDHI